MSPVNENSTQEIKAEILRLTRRYSQLAHAKFLPADLQEGIEENSTKSVPYAGRVFGYEEVEAAVDSTLEFWLTLGRDGERFQQTFAEKFGHKSSLLVNSGSSANLIAFATLCSPQIPEKQRVMAGDEVITVAAGFPTTVSPIVQYGCIPVFVDIDPHTLNIDTTQLHEALSDRTKAVMIAHTLGNPFDLYEVVRFCRENKLWLIEDNCDALGSIYRLPTDLANNINIYESSPGIKNVRGYISRWTGTLGDISTQSFYPPHHITMGEGGLVSFPRDMRLKKIAESIRDWGRDCWCPSGKDNSCGKRFEWKKGDLPKGYDHKYIYSHFGYNLKPLDIQASIGLQQLNRLESFIELRQRNWSFLRSSLATHEKYFEFSEPTQSDKYKYANDDNSYISGYENVSWFGFYVGVRDSAPFTRNELIAHLNANSIGTRLVFGGNLTKQPLFKQLPKDKYRIVSDLRNTDKIMKQGLFLGVYPGLTIDQLKYTVLSIQSFIDDL